jgi:hypothetical protein
LKDTDLIYHRALYLAASCFKPDIKIVWDVIYNKYSFYRDNVLIKECKIDDIEKAKEELIKL